MFQKVFKGCLVDALRGKTRVVAMNQLRFLPECDYVISLGDGCIEEQGTFAELMENNGTVAKLYTKHVADEKNQEDKQEEEAKEEPKGGIKRKENTGEPLTLPTKSFP